MEFKYVGSIAYVRSLIKYGLRNGVTMDDDFGITKRNGWLHAQACY